MLNKTFKTTGKLILRYGLAITFIWLGLLKFKNSEADYLKELLANSALFGWLLKYITHYAFAQLIAWLQILIGILLLARPISKKLSFWGGIMASVILIISVSTLFVSNYVWQPPYGFPELSKIGQSILKDVVLLGAALWSVGDSA